MAAANAVAPIPQSITLHAQSRVLEIAYADGAVFRVPFELMRVYSPSAAVQGHGPGQEVLQTGKREVGITSLEPVGHYALKPTFSDGHDSGIFSWAFLYEMGQNQDALWAEYLQRLQDAQLDRDAPMGGKSAAGAASGGGGACGSGQCGCH